VGVVIPALNEERSLPLVLAALPHSLIEEIVVVDNGSSDRTAAVAVEGGARVVHEPRRGYGSACLAGIAALSDVDVVAFVDADYSDHPEELALLLEPILTDRADLVIGSRMVGEREPGALLPQALFGNWLGLVVLLAGWLLLLYWLSDDGKSLHKRVVVRMFLFALFLRFAVPLTLIANDALYQLFLEPRYVNSTEVIEHAGQDIRALSERDPDNGEAGDEEYFFSSIIGSMGRAIRDTADGLDLSDRVNRITERARDMVEHVIQLSVVFILQTGILPIAFLWLFLQGARLLFRPFRN
jgi:glycosyltransferase involved in cell wall biosynthesis